LGELTVVAFTLSFPSWESATFFSSSLVESPKEFDVVQLYVPTNPFFSRSNSVVPAIVLFSLALGLAVIGVPKKGSFLADLEIVGEALMRIPADMFQLFVAVDVFTGRFGTLLAGVHTVVLALLTAGVTRRPLITTIGLGSACQGTP
jgi:Na+/H+-dicarboxylate symporter